MLRAILLFPKFSNSHIIDALRANYDPLAQLIPPHITLVFPFDSGVTTDLLNEHLQQCLIGVKPFRLVLAGITGAEDEYLFLNVKIGNDALIELHDRLYTGVLRGCLNRSLTYTPHLTVGRIQDPHILALALADTEHVDEMFEATIHEVLVENIDERGQSTIEITVPLNP